MLVVALAPFDFASFSCAKLTEVRDKKTMSVRAYLFIGGLLDEILDRDPGGLFLIRPDALKVQKVNRALR